MAAGQEELGQIGGGEDKLGEPGEEASSGRNKKVGMGPVCKMSESQPKGASGRVA